MILEHMDGTETRTQDLADKIEREEQLRTGWFYGRDKCRCYEGVLFDYTLDPMTGEIEPGRAELTQRSRSAFARALGGHPIALNDGFIGTNEERCKYMARITREIP